MFVTLVSLRCCGVLMLHLDLPWPAATGGRSCPDYGWQEAGSGSPAGLHWYQPSPGSQRCCGCHSEPGQWRWNRPTWHCTGSPPGWLQWCHSPQLGPSCLRNRQTKMETETLKFYGLVHCSGLVGCTYLGFCHTQKNSYKRTGLAVVIWPVEGDKGKGPCFLDVQTDVQALHK